MCVRKNYQGGSFGMSLSSRTLSIKPNNLDMLGKHSTFELHSQPYKNKEFEDG